MRQQLKCVSCGGTYFDQSEPGVRYFHSCPPVLVTPAKGDPALPGFVPAVYGQHPNARDENLVFPPGPDPENPQKRGDPVPKADGLGVTVVAVVP